MTSTQDAVPALKGRRCDCIFVEPAVHRERAEIRWYHRYIRLSFVTGVFCFNVAKMRTKRERKIMRKITSSILTAVLAATLTGCSTSTAVSTDDSEKTTYTVAIVKQLDHASLDEIADAICAELDALAEENGITIEYGEVYSGQNDQTTLTQIGDSVVANDVDVIIPIATLAAQTMVVSADGTDIPIVYAAVSDPESAELTGIENVTGTSDALNTEQLMDMMFTENPDIESVGLLYSKSETNSEKPIEDAKAYLDEADIEYVEATGNTNDEIIAAVSSLIASGVDAIFTPTDNVVMAAELAIADTLIEAGIPHYTGADSFVRNGAYVTCGVNYTDLGTQTADLAYQAMTEGMDDMEDYYVVDGGLITVNSETAEGLGLDPSVFESFGTVTEVTTTED